MTSRNPYLPDGRLSRESLISQTITAIRWSLAFLVVINHYLRAGNFNFGSFEINASTYTWLCTVEELFMSLFKNCLVPVFFFISGFLTSMGQDSFLWERYKAKMKRLPREIIIPYVIWILFAFFIRVIYLYLNGFPVRYQFPAEHHYFFVGELIWLRRVFFGWPFPENVPLWYMRDYFILLISLPLWDYLLRKTKGWFLILPAVIFLYYFNAIRGFRFEISLMFFGCGYLARMKQLDVLGVFRRYFIPALICYIAGATICFVYYHYDIGTLMSSHTASICKNIVICCFVPVSITTVSYIVKKGWLKVSGMMASASFFVYVTHYPIKKILFEAGFMLCDCQVYPDRIPWVIVGISVFTPVILTFVFIPLYKAFPRFIKFIDGR